MLSITRLTRKLARTLIVIYQRTISLDHGPLAKLFPYRICRYAPTCSEYAYKAIERYGFFKGIYLAARRLLRCTPWHIGGHDPLP
ncbi:membrane protein insertion efficiency factor YidD [bacterium]|nr:membrane protein insertion efficiency factor YidD [Patescibacteria group bacterium]MBU1634043.1 membrane protein insertion efficiency factor YidD [bacterium]